MYTLSLALTTATTVLALKLIDRPRSLPALVGYAICAAAAMHVHYFAAFVLLALNLYVLFLLALDRKGVPFSGAPRFSGSDQRSTDGALLFRWPLAQIGAAALSAPWLINAWQTLTGYHGNGDSPRVRSNAVAVLRRLRPGRNSTASHLAIRRRHFGGRGNRRGHTLWSLQRAQGS